VYVAPPDYNNNNTKPFFAGWEELIGLLAQGSPSGWRDFAFDAVFVKRLYLSRLPP
jgi:hypothetical protein